MADNSISNIPVQIFANYIVEKLRRTNPHLNCVVDESNYVLAGAVVHIPQAGNSPNVVKNRKIFPAVAVQRADNFVTYPLNVYTTDPIHVTWHEENEISFDKTDSVLGDIVATLTGSIGDNIVYDWLTGLKSDGTSDRIPAQNIFRTTGANADVNPDDGQTGQRKAFTYREIDRVVAAMNKAGVSKLGRYAMIESYQYQQLIDSFSSNQMAAFQSLADLKNGIVGKYNGVSIMERSYVCAFDNGTTNLLFPEQALQATSNLGSLVWQRDCLAKSVGDILPFQNVKDATYFGDVLSGLAKFGGRCRRIDWKGVHVILQDNV